MDQIEAKWHQPRPSTEEIIASQILSKAAYKKDDKTYIVCLFKQSYEYKCFFVFATKTARSPRKSWKLRTYFILRDGRTVEDIISRLQGEQIGKTKYPAGKRAAAAHLERLQKPPEVYIPANADKQTRMMNRKVAAGRAGRLSLLLSKG